MDAISRAHNRQRCRDDDDDDDDDKNRSEIPTYLAVEKGGEAETGGEKVRSFKISREAGHSR